MPEMPLARRNERIFASRSSALSATGPLAQPRFDRELIFVWALGPAIKVELEAVC